RQGVQAASREVQKAALVYAEAATLSQLDCGEIAGIAARLMSPKPDEAPDQQIDPRAIAKLYVKAQASRDVMQSFFQRCFSETSPSQHEAALETVPWFANDPKLV